MSRMHMVQKPTLQIKKTASQTLVAGDLRLLTFDAPTVNTAGFTESSDVFTCTIPGWYLWHGLFATDVSTNSAANYATYAYKNGSGLAAFSGWTYKINEFCEPVYLDIGDTLEFKVYPTTYDIVLDATGIYGVVRLVLL